MSTSNGTQGSRRRALRAAPFVAVALFSALAAGLVALRPAPRTDQFVLAGYGRSDLDSTAENARASVNFWPGTHGTFRITGSVAGLYPGSKRALVLTVTNPQAFAVVVTGITTTVSSARAACSASNLSIGVFSGQLHLPPRGSAMVSVNASLRQTTTDACIGTAFNLAYRGLARKL
jgi:hypothetical protein